MITALYWAVFIAAALGTAIILIRWAETQAAFYPRPGPTPAPPPFESFTVTADDGVRLVGWHAEINGAGPVLLYLCGNAGNIADRTDLLLGALGHGIGVCTVNYRGTGESAGSPTEEGVYLDALAVYDYLVGEKQVNPSRIVVWGHSLGGAVAAELTQQRQCAGLILESTFRSAKEMANRMVPLLPVSWAMKLRLDNEKAVRRITLPKLFIHGTADPVVPVEDSRYLHEIAADPKELWLVDGADHNGVYLTAGDAFYDRITSFARQVTGVDGQVPSTPVE